jgi:hypothetical protein
MKTLTRNLFVFFIIFFVIIAGCVAPPKPGAGTPSSTGGGVIPGTGQDGGTETPTPQYVTIENPYQPSTTESSHRITMLPTIPTLDEYVQIYSKTQYFGWNGTAFSFNLTKPPMIINFVLSPVNVTGTKFITNRLTGAEETVTYDYYSPYSWFEITVRDKNSERVIIKDGFGSYKQYSVDTGQDVPRTMKINQPGIVKIDVAGNQITATVNVSVIKAGNFNT